MYSAGASTQSSLPDSPCFCSLSATGSKTVNYLQVSEDKVWKHCSKRVSFRQDLTLKAEAPVPGSRQPAGAASGGIRPPTRVPGSRQAAGAASGGSRSPRRAPPAPTFSLLGSGAALPSTASVKQGLSHTRLSMDDNVQDIQDAQGKQDYSSMPCLACRGRTHLLTDPQGSGEDLAGVSGFGCGTGAGEVAERAQRGVAKGRDDAVAGDGELKLHSCELCGFSTRYANHVKRHMKTHSGERPYRCPLCAYASGQLVNLQRHVRVHTGEKPYQCRLCAFACSSLGNLKRHQRMHTLGRHGRRPGGNQARLMAGQRPGKAPPGDLDTVAANRAAHVSGDGSYRSYSAASQACESGSPPDTEKPAKGAGEAAGGGEGGLPGPPFSQACRLCGRDTAERGSSCGRICGRCMLDVLSKELPRVLAGGGEKAYPCAVCPFVTHYPNHLVRHMKTHSGEKPYRCPECDYASAHLDNLKRHHRVHTGEKPYRCQLCDYACGNLANLRRHQRVHSGAKPFQCTVCNYSCNQSMNLKRHMLRHTGCKPFCCPECPYATGHWDNYKRHQRKHGRPAEGWLRVRLPNDGGGEEEEEEEGAEEEAQLDQME